MAAVASCITESITRAISSCFRLASFSAALLTSPRIQNRNAIERLELAHCVLSFSEIGRGVRIWRRRGLSRPRDCDDYIAQRKQRPR